MVKSAKFKVGDMVEYLNTSQMFPYKCGIVVEIEEYPSGNVRVSVDFRPLRKIPQFWVWQEDLKLLTPLEKEML